MTTPLDIIKLALKDAGALGVGQTPLDEDVNDAFERLNWMMSSWARKRWLVYHLIDLAKVSTGAQFYTIGPGGDFEISVRPDKLASAFMRQNPGATSTVPNIQAVTPSGSPFVYVADEAGVLTLQGGTVSALFYSSATINPGWVVATSPIVMQAGDAVQVQYTVAPAMAFAPAAVTTAPAAIPANAIDYPITILNSREDYNRIAMKGIAPNFTYYLFYDTAYPLGYLWPFPPPMVSTYELHVSVKAPLSEFTSLSQTIDLPPEYKAAIHYNLADRLRSAYQLPVPPNDKVAGWARDALNVLRSSNTQIPRLTMPSSLRSRRNTYNFYSDQS